MAYKILLLLLFVSTTINGQELKEKLEKDVCLCLTEAENIELKTVTACFSSKMTAYEKDLEKLVDKNSALSEYEQGRIIGKQLFSEMQTSLIRNCDAYYNFFQRLRTESIVSMQEHYTQQLIDSIDRELVENKSIDLLLIRGNAYFTKNQLEKAKELYYECLSLDSNHAQTTFFLGWVKEKEGHYQEAVELYEKIYRMTQKQEVLIFAELARRKSTE